ncbi:MAG TPA: TIGR03435 family protein [Bryobacteraceae bacterium]|jgi:uncharacterized protein (TIGR03435 family)
MNIVLALALILPAAGFAQMVAVIRPSDPAACREYPIIDDRGGAYDMRCVRIHFLLQTAFGVRAFQISGGPGWITSDRYDIAAKRETSANDIPEKDVSELTDKERQTKGALLRETLQRLLADRFQLRTHRETKQLPIYLLTVASGGSKLESAGSSDVSGGLRPGRGLLAGDRTDVPFLARALSEIVGRPVVDQTGLTGKYNFELKWNPEMGSANTALGETPSVVPAADPDRATIFTALQEQLGLRLSSGKGPVEVIVVDHLARPTEN